MSRASHLSARRLSWALALALFLAPACARKQQDPSPGPRPEMSGMAAAVLVASGHLQDRLVAVGRVDHVGGAEAAYAELVARDLDDILARLAPEYGYRVLDRGLVLDLAGRQGLDLTPRAPHKDLEVLREATGAEVLVTGWVQQKGEEEKLTAYALDTATGRVLDQWRDADQGAAARTRPGARAMEKPGL